MVSISACAEFCSITVNGLPVSCDLKTEISINKVSVYYFYKCIIATDIVEHSTTIYPKHIMTNSGVSYTSSQ
jgi:hypothetical protein